MRFRVIAPVIFVLAVGTLVFLHLRPLAVEVVSAETRRVVEVIYATGVVAPDTETAVAAEVPGRIVELNVDEGDLVEFGQQLARLDDRLARLRLAEAVSQLRSAEARLAQITAPADPYDVRQRESGVAAAQAGTRSLEAKREGASEAVTVAERGLASAQATLESARARLLSARKAVEVAKGQVAEGRARIMTLGSELDAARAEEKSARDLRSRRRKLFAEGAISARQATEAETAQESAGARVRAAVSRVTEAGRAVQRSEANVASSEALVAEAEAKVTAAAADLEAQRSRVAQAQRTVDDYGRQIEASRAEAQGAREQLGQTRRGARQVDIAVLREEARTRQSAVARARQEVDDHIIRAPVSGRVTVRLHDPGDYLAAGAPLLQVASESRIYVRADVDEADIGPVRVGQEARFRVDAFSQRDFTARVSRIADSADRATKTYAVELRQLSDATDLLIGMTADVNIVGPAVENAVVVPLEALVQSEGGNAVFVVEDQSRVSRRPVQIRARDPQWVQIISGLESGERVVMRPPPSLQDGQTVRVRGGGG